MMGKAARRARRAVETPPPPERVMRISPLPASFDVLDQAQKRAVTDVLDRRESRDIALRELDAAVRAARRRNVSWARIAWALGANAEATRRKYSGTP